MGLFKVTSGNLGRMPIAWPPMQLVKLLKKIVKLLKKIVKLLMKNLLRYIWDF
jgi:hypothetical protein